MSLVGDILGGVLGSNAAKNASNTLQQGSEQAQNTIEQQQQAALAAQKAATQQQTALQAPYTTLGGQSANSLTSLLAPGGSLTQGYGSFQAPTGVDFTNDPGYQFQLNQGLNALQNSAAARGGLLDTGTAKSLNDYAQGTASQAYQNVYNNALNTYNANANTFYNNQNNLYSRLMGGTGVGQGSAQQLSSLSQQGAQNQGSIDLTSGSEIANQINNAAAARASGIIGSNNAWMGALGGLSNIGQSFLNSQQGAGSMFNQSGNSVLNFLGSAGSFI